MASVNEKVESVDFTVRTGMDSDGIRQAGLRAIEAGRRFMTSTVKELSVNFGSIVYVIEGPGGLVLQSCLF